MPDRNALDGADTSDATDDATGDGATGAAALGATGDGATGAAVLDATDASDAEALGKTDALEGMAAELGAGIIGHDPNTTVTGDTGAGALTATVGADALTVGAGGADGLDGPGVPLDAMPAEPLGVSVGNAGTLVVGRLGTDDTGGSRSAGSVLGTTGYGRALIPNNELRYPSGSGG